MSLPTEPLEIIVIDTFVSVPSKRSGSQTVPTKSDEYSNLTRIPQN